MTGRHGSPIPDFPVTPRTEARLAVAPPINRQPSRFGIHAGLLLANLLLLLLLTFQLFHRPSYEYMTAQPDDVTFSDEMNDLGRQGWKTESCRRASDGADYSPTFNYECIMSRPKLGW